MEQPNLNYIQELFGDSVVEKNLKPTNSEFIRVIADEVKKIKK